MTLSRPNSDMLIMIIIITKILFQLPIKTLIRCLKISSKWHNWISSSYFIKMQVYYAIQTKTHFEVLIYHEDYNGFLQNCNASFKNEVLGNAVEIYPLLRSIDICYCHGLNERTQFVMWNPFIRRYRILLEEFISNPFKLEFETKFMFGYDIVNNDYKVLKVVEFQKKRPKIQEVWLATNLGVDWSRSVCVNGPLHWLLSESNKCSVIFFNLATEKFKYYKTTTQLDANKYKMCHLEVIKEKVCFITVLKNEGKTYNEVWVMNNYGIDICLFIDWNDRTQFIIWNPFIRRYKIFPEEFISNPFKLEFETKFTFGYDVVNDDYKVLRVVGFQKKRPKIQEVWPATNIGVNWSRFVCVNGSLHWLLLESNKYFVICFNLATEKFKYYKTPAQLDANRYRMCHLEVIKEKVCFTTMLKNEGKTFNEVWVMNEYWIDSSWTRVYKIEQASEPTFFEYLKLVYLYSNGK
ncbi:f-box/kelch-repeat protein [Quercus suber]|uniref:F-box/kelch-repeat protein n=1 Tax=Quercus suber TaxID=58331 RepID=A0AAW0KQT7_QUESU